MVTVKWTESAHDLKQECKKHHIYKPHQEVYHKKECICRDPTKECHPPSDLNRKPNPSTPIHKYPFNAVQNLARLG